jgi:hypothetical protein
VVTTPAAAVKLADQIAPEKYSKSVTTMDVTDRMPSGFGKIVAIMIGLA